MNKHSLIAVLVKFYFVAVIFGAIWFICFDNTYSNKVSVKADDNAFVSADSICSENPKTAEIK